MKVFVEEQRFTQWWIYTIIAVPFLALLLPYVFKLEEFNNDNETITALSISFIIIILVFILVFSVRLRTKIDEKGIYYQFSPVNFNEKFIPWSDITNCYVRTYNPIREYGGWGYKWRFSGGKGLNIRGNIGIQIEFKNSKKLLLGTQKHEEVKRILETYKDKFKKS